MATFITSYCMPHALCMFGLICRSLGHGGILTFVLFGSPPLPRSVDSIPLPVQCDLLWIPSSAQRDRRVPEPKELPLQFSSLYGLSFLLFSLCNVPLYGPYIPLCHIPHVSSLTVAFSLSALLPNHVCLMTSSCWPVYVAASGLRGSLPSFSSDPPHCPGV